MVGSKNGVVSSGVPTWSSKVLSRVLARTHGGNSTALINDDDVIIDRNVRVVVKAVVTNR